MQYDCQKLAQILFFVKYIQFIEIKYFFDFLEGNKNFSWVRKNVQN
jgi:hypothetical protein